MSERIVVKRLPRGETTPEGAFYARVDGSNVGVDDRAFWPTRADAMRCGVRYLTAKVTALASPAPAER